MICPKCGDSFEGGTTVNGTTYCGPECSQRAALVPGIVAGVLLFACVLYLVWFADSCASLVR